MLYTRTQATLYDEQGLRTYPNWPECAQKYAASSSVNKCSVVSLGRSLAQFLLVVTAKSYEIVMALSTNYRAASHAQQAVHACRLLWPMHRRVATAWSQRSGATASRRCCHMLIRH